MSALRANKQWSWNLRLACGSWQQYVPGQAMLLKHSCVCMLVPMHMLPLYLGWGLVHVRLRVWLPLSPLQGAAKQGPQLDQADQLPSTRKSDTTRWGDIQLTGLTTAFQHDDSGHSQTFDCKSTSSFCMVSNIGVWRWALLACANDPVGKAMSEIDVTCDWWRVVPHLDGRQTPNNRGCQSPWQIDTYQDTGTSSSRPAPPETGLCSFYHHAWVEGHHNFWFSRECHPHMWHHSWSIYPTVSSRHQLKQMSGRSQRFWLVSGQQHKVCNSKTWTEQQKTGNE